MLQCKSHLQPLLVLSANFQKYWGPAEKKKNNNKGDSEYCKSYLTFFCHVAKCLSVPYSKRPANCIHQWGACQTGIKVNSPGRGGGQVGLQASHRVPGYLLLSFTSEAIKKAVVCVGGWFLRVALASFVAQNQQPYSPPVFSCPMFLPSHQEALDLSITELASTCLLVFCQAQDSRTLFPHLLSRTKTQSQMHKIIEW